MKKIVFITGTRADFGKLKTLMRAIETSQEFELFVFVTGMHMLSKYGMTIKEVEAESYKNLHMFINQQLSDTMDVVLAKTVQGLSDYVKEVEPDLIIVHGDRVEALGGSIVGSLNNILVGHIEGGEVSGTIDELIRHSVSKMSHIHFVSNGDAKKRLLQLGELEKTIHVIGSPDMDVMLSKSLPKISEVKFRYDIEFDAYNILLYHPVTTELDMLKGNINHIVNECIKSNEKFIVIYPNNDAGSSDIINSYNRLANNTNFKIFPSIRFEYFLTLLKNADSIIGNSSAGIREMPYYGRPTINIGSRQYKRSSCKTIINIDERSPYLLTELKKIGSTSKVTISQDFGDGKSNEKFLSIINDDIIWNMPKQKYFNDLKW